MAESSANRRKLLRKAEHVDQNPEIAAELAREGIQLGEPQVILPSELEAELEAADVESGPSVGITVFLDETLVKDRGEIEDPLADYLEANDIGEWLGSGQGKIGDQSFFDVSFAVHDLNLAVPLIQRKLRELGAGPNTEVSTSSGHVYRLCDAA